jgi:hypothetical protein
LLVAPAMSEHEFCKPALTALSAPHRARTAGNSEVRSRSGESVERIFSHEEPTEVVDAEKYGSAERLVSLVPSRPTAVATSSVEAADRLGVPGKVSQLLRIIQNSQDYSELLEGIAVRPH